MPLRPSLSRIVASVAVLLGGGALAAAAEPVKKPLQLMDVFQLQFASDPQASPDGKRIVYVRNFMDVMHDRARSNIWIVNADGKNHEALTTGNQRDSNPRWSPDGSRLLYISDVSGKPQLYCRWLSTGRTAKVTDLTAAPLGPSWSPDGKQIAFVQRVLTPVKPFVELPPRPQGAEWAPPFKLIRNLVYRADGQGYLSEGYRQVFVMPADGGAPQQVTEGPHDHAGPPDDEAGPAWSPDGKSLFFAANRHTGGEFNPIDTEIFELTLADRKLRPLTSRRGPDHYPVVSPDGQQIAYLGFDDKLMSYQQQHLYVMDRDGKNPRQLATKLDRPIKTPAWSKDGKGVYFLYEDQGNGKVGLADLDGETKTVAGHIGGIYLGRPYASGSFSVGGNDAIAFTRSTSLRPSDVAVIQAGAKKFATVTALNASLFSDRAVAKAEEISYSSPADGRKVQAWILKPPGFDAKKKYPLILEIHGGPFADYGDRFAMELQLYAAAGYVVVYVNPRGSTGYGEEFAQLIHHRYPGPDFDDLMAGVDAVAQRGYVDRDNLYVTGGSGGGILTAWIVGKTPRFRAAVSCFPVVNWQSAVLNTDLSALFTRHWFPGPPWEHAEHYRQRSPLSLAGNVTTPTMLLTGEEDFRTPISEAEQFYKALKLRHIDTALVRVPGASHNVSARPSHLIAKVAYVLKWFEMHRKR